MRIGQGPPWPRMDAHQLISSSIHFITTIRDDRIRAGVNLSWGLARVTFRSLAAQLMTSVRSEVVVFYDPNVGENPSLQTENSRVDQNARFPFAECETCGTKM